MHAAIATVLLAPALAAAAHRSAPAPKLPAPQAELRVVASPTGRWQVVVENRDRAPVRLDADARLLRLEVEPTAAAEEDAPKKKARSAKETKPVACALPADMRPGDVERDRAVVLAPGARWEESFDPALYCFDARSADALARGGRVTAHLGFPGRAKASAKGAAAATGPAVVAPAEEDAELAPVRELDAAPIVVEPRATSAAESDDVAKPPIGVTTPPRVSARSDRELVLAVTVSNVGSEPLPIRIRRDHLAFDVDGPSGSFRCGSVAVQHHAPARELFTTLRHGHGERMDVLLHELCPDDAFDRPGLYAVKTSVTPNDSGAGHGISAWTGTATSARPTLVRVERAPRPFYSSPPVVVGGSDG